MKSGRVIPSTRTSLFVCEMQGFMLLSKRFWQSFARTLLYASWQNKINNYYKQEDFVSAPACVHERQKDRTTEWYFTIDQAATESSDSSPDSDTPCRDRRSRFRTWTPVPRKTRLLFFLSPKAVEEQYYLAPKQNDTHYYLKNSQSRVEYSSGKLES